jgi:uroporphyrinogen III methyltransferase/synthase
MLSAQVFLVGAGPGNAGLLTLRAVECLRQADLVLYDRLVASALLNLAPVSAERRCVTELAGDHPARVPEVNRLMIEAARQGKRVVRLKGGDPFVFGRGAEEVEALRAAGIAFEVVHGVTAALGAAAYAGIPLTDRRFASAVAFVTGHECPGKEASALDWEALARFPGTLVFYMGVRRLGPIAVALIENGKPPQTSAALVQLATSGRQRTVTTTLADLAESASQAHITAPALTIVGPVVDLRPHLDWFEQQPLFGQGVLVTRPRQQADDLIHRLEALGAIPYLLPTVEIHDLTDARPVDEAIANLRRYDWLVFTSPNGVRSLIRRLRASGRDLRALGGVKLAVIGPSTGDALREYHLEPDLMPAEYNSESLAALLKIHASGQRILLARADRGRDVLQRELSPDASVQQIAVYSQIDVAEAEPEVLTALRNGDVRFVTLTSSNIARSLARLTDTAIHERIRSGSIQLVTISGVTSADVRALGWPVAAEARTATVEGVLEAVIKLAVREHKNELRGT